MTSIINTNIDVANGEVINDDRDLNNIRRDDCVLELKYPPLVRLLKTGCWDRSKSA